VLDDKIKKINLKKYCKAKKYNNKKSIRFDRKNLKNDEKEKNKLQKNI